MDITINGKDFKKLKWKETMEILVEEFVKHEIAEANLDIMEEMSNTDKEIIERAKQKYGIGNAQGLITCAKCSQEFEEIPEWGDHIIECNHEGTVWDCPNCPVCLEILDTLDKLNNHIELFEELHPGHNMEEWIENQFDLKYKDFFDAFTSKCKLDKKYFEFMSKQAQEGLDYPQPIPWSLAQCVMYNWEYGCRKYLEAHENQKTTWNQIKRKFREGYHYIRSIPQSWREKVYGRVDVVFQAIEEMKESLNKVVTLCTNICNEWGHNVFGACKISYMENTY
uniref:Uncharacterized protein n=1 Tax=Schyzocotyle acheilognathi TaxID=135513 RepID=Q5VKI7_SCHAC|nr:hypothetical protein [Schyzocotyle acheilognathi]